MEELGLPIVWPGACDDPSCQAFGPVPQSYEVITPAQYFPNCSPGNINAECGEDPLYKVDFFLFEGYGMKQMLDDHALFDSVFPDKALLARQYMAFPFDNIVFSHKALAGWMDHFTAKIYESKRLHDPTDCTPIYVTSNNHIAFDDTVPPPGSFACFNEEVHNHEYTTCPRVVTYAQSSESGLSNF